MRNIGNLKSPPTTTLVDAAFRSLRRPLINLFIFGFFLNLLALASPLYMMQVYERVIASRSEVTLVMLTLIAILALVANSLLERFRSSGFLRCAAQLDQQLSPAVFETVHRSMIKRPGLYSASNLRDVDALRECVSGSGLSSILDAPWISIFIFASWLIHPWFPILILLSSILVALFTYLSNVFASQSLIRAREAELKANEGASAIFSQPEVIQAMGMRPALKTRWAAERAAMLTWQLSGSERSGLFIAVSRFIRTFTQIAALGLGAYLALENQISPGQMFGVSIIVSRALAPIESVISNWKGIVAGRHAYGRLQELFRSTTTAPEHVSLARPAGRLTAENVTVAIPTSSGMPRIVLRNINFDLPAGQVLAIVGPSAAGKSSLLRTLLGVWPPAFGEIRIDGADLSHWQDDELGSYLGYLPQDVALFAGTVHQNIARFRSGVTLSEVQNAAALANVHEMILVLTDGYNTALGAHGSGLSGGQRQRLGLARAVFGSPSLVVLDEPNSNLDGDGETHLVNTIRELRERGTSIVYVTHKASLLSLADQILVLGAGGVQHYGSRDDILRQISGPRTIQFQPAAFKR